METTREGKRKREMKDKKCGYLACMCGGESEMDEPHLGNHNFMPQE